MLNLRFPQVVTAIVKTVIAVIQDPQCAIFSALTLPGFMYSEVGFAVINGWPLHKGDSTTPDQDYFISPLHGSVSHDDNIRIFYGAKFGPGFGGAAAVTFGKLIYMRADQSATTANSPLLGDSAFRQKTKTLLHEFTHVQQYRDLGYVGPLFGARYLFDYCTVRSQVITAVNILPLPIFQSVPDPPWLLLSSRVALGRIQLRRERA